MSHVVDRTSIHLSTEGINNELKRIEEEREREKEGGGGRERERANQTILTVLPNSFNENNLKWQSRLPTWQQKPNTR